MRTNLHRNLLAVDYKSLLLEVRLPYLFGVALREADVAAELLALASDFTLLHVVNPFIPATLLRLKHSGLNYICFNAKSQGLKQGR